MNAIAGPVLDRLYNLHWVTEDIARSAQPYLGFYAAFLDCHGFRSLINLRGENPRIGWWKRESRICARLGIAHFDVRLSSRRLPQREVLASLFDTFDAAAKPMLFKCSGGQDRTSFACALYLLHRRGAGALAQAQAQFSLWPYLHMPQHQQHWLRLFPAFALEDARGMPLAEWARTRYAPERLADWLTARGLAKSFRGIRPAAPFRNKS